MPNLRPARPFAAVFALLAAACGSTPERPPLTLAPKVDIQRFMGDWYVIANIPTFLEKGAHSAMDSYRLEADGSIFTTFSFRADSFEGAQKSYTSRGFVAGGNGAIWGMQYIWPIKADYRIAYIADDYATTIVAREKRDYVWIMARTPTISQEQLAKLKAMVGTLGYDTALIQMVPQKAG
jgi:apolipoprotein D and lipocalin family protein